MLYTLLISESHSSTLLAIKSLSSALAILYISIRSKQDHVKKIYYLDLLLLNGDVKCIYILTILPIFTTKKILLPQKNKHLLFFG